MSMLSIGVTGLNAAQIGLLTTEHNISNANTEGYNRQRAVQSTGIAFQTGSGFIGQGTTVQTVQRLYNDVVSGQVAQSATRASELDAYYDQITLIDNMLADPNSGLSPALQDFFTGVQQVAADPASLPARQAMTSSGEALVTRFRSIEQRLGEQYANINDQLTHHVELVNSYAGQIADVNQRIVVAQSTSGQPANDLLDQRDRLVAQLNLEIRVAVVTQNDGTFSVFAGNGQQLVIGGTANRLAATPSLDDSSRMAVSLNTGRNIQELPESVLNGGVIGGLVRFRSESLDPAANALGRVAASMALTFNAQHSLGQDLLGNIAGETGFAGDFFQIGTPRLIGNSRNSGNADITATFIQPPPMRFNNGDFSITYDAGSGNYNVLSQKYGIGPGAVNGPVSGPDLGAVLAQVDAIANVPAIDLNSGNFMTELSLSDYRVQFDAGGSAYTVTRLVDNTAVGAGTVGGGPIQFDGIQLDVPTTAAGSNDSYVLQPTREIARNVVLNQTIAADPRLVAAAGPARSAAGSTNTGNSKIEVTGLMPGYDAPSNALPIQMSYLNGQLTINNTVNGSVAVTIGGTTTLTASPIAYVADAVVTVDGISFKMTGTPKNGDTFTLERNANAVADSRNALLFGKLQVQDTMSGGKTSFQGAYAQLVSSVGNKTREVEVTGEAQKSLLEQAMAARESMSGVNLDEEAANLIRFQQAYQAAAKVIDIGSRLFDTLLTLGR